MYGQVVDNLWEQWTVSGQRWEHWTISRQLKGALDRQWTSFGDSGQSVETFGSTGLSEVQHLAAMYGQWTTLGSTGQS